MRNVTVWMIVGVSVIAAVLALTLRQTFPSAATVLTLAAGVLLLGAALTAALPIFSKVNTLMQQRVDNMFTTVLFKALGISLLTQTAADVCRDAGETALAGKAETAGQVLLLVCAMPLFEYAVSLLDSVISGQAVGF